MSEPMPKPVKNALRILLKRGTKEQNDAYIGEEGEITIVVNTEVKPIETPTEEVEPN